MGLLLRVGGYMSGFVLRRGGVFLVLVAAFYAVALTQDAAAVTSSFTGTHTQSGRIFRDAIPSSCPSKAYPGIFNAGTTYNYETFTYTNSTGAPICQQFDFDPNVGGTPCATNAHASAYLGSYDPTNQAANFLGDVGSSVTQPFSVEIPANATVVLVVTNTAAAAICDFAISPTGSNLDVAGNRQRTIDLIYQYLHNRIRQLAASEPDADRRISRLSGTSSGAPFNVTAMQADGGATATFSTSLSELRAARMSSGPAMSVAPGYVPASGVADDLVSNNAAVTASASPGPENAPLPTGEALALAEPQLGPTVDQSRFDIWTQLQATYFNDDEFGMDSNGYFTTAYVGADYKLGSRVLIGVLGQFDHLSQDWQTPTASASGNGWMAGPYATVKLFDHLYFDGRAAWGQSFNRISPFGTYTDSFDTRRWLVRGGLIGDWRSGNWVLQPHSDVVYVEEHQLGYTDTNGIAIPDQTVSLGQLDFGPSVAYQMVTPSGVVIEPRAELTGIWAFIQDSSRSLSFAPDAGEELRGKAELGVTVRGQRGVALQAAGSYDGIGTNDYNALSGRVRLTVPLQ